MKYINIKKFSDSQFKRLTGISWSTYHVMLDELKRHIPTKGRPSKLDLEDQLLMSLSYWRGYRTLFHVGMAYGVSEATTSRIIRHVEDCLIHSKLFNLPKKLPQGSEIDWDIVIVDATDIPVQRPKNRERAIAERKKHIRLKFKQ